jgi:hypothetical protein
MSWLASSFAKGPGGSPLGIIEGASKGAESHRLGMFNLDQLADGVEN